MRHSFLFFLSILCIELKAQISFENVTEKAGIQHAHTSPMYMGGGVTFIDYDNDGFDDIFLTGGVKSDKLYRNLGDFTFEDVTRETGLLKIGQEHSNGAVAGDINNDGYKDIFVSYGVGETNRLYLNIEGKRFREITSTSGLTNLAWSMGASFGDFNLDGLLDLYVINWVEEFDGIVDEQGNTTGFSHSCFGNNLYLNNGDNTFAEITPDYNADNNGCGLAVLTTDYNNDTYPDIYVANDFGEWVVPNTLLKNQYPQQTFTNLSATTGLDAAVYGMGIAAGDYDRNGLIDYYVTNIGRNVLHKNDDQQYLDFTTEARVENTTANDLNTTGWGAVFSDLDNDGYEDLLVANGYVPVADFIATSQKDPNKLYFNNQDGTFADRSSEFAVDDPGISRGVAVSDLDNDGDMDFLFTYLNTELFDDPRNGNVLLYENKSTSDNHFVKFKLEGVVCNRDAYNTRVMVYSQGQQLIRELYSGSSHNSQNSSLLHVGLGELSSIDSVVVKWPGGSEQKFVGLESDQTYYIKEGGVNAKIMGCDNPASPNYNDKAEISFGCRFAEVTALDNDITALDFTLYPNPVAEQLNILFETPESSLTHFEILSLEGKALISKDKSIVNSTSISINVSQLSTGVYFIRVYNGERTIMLRFLKE